MSVCQKLLKREPLASSGFGANKIGAVSLFDSPSVLEEIVPTPGKEKSEPLPRKKDKGADKSWKTFLSLFYEGGKKKVPNPNPKTRDRWPEVHVNTALKYRSFAKKIRKEFQDWRAQIETPQSKMPSWLTGPPQKEPLLQKQEEEPASSNAIKLKKLKVLRSVSSVEEVRPRDAISWEQPNGERVIGRVVRIEEDENAFLLYAINEKGDIIKPYLVDQDDIDKLSLKIVSSKDIPEVHMEEPEPPSFSPIHKAPSFPSDLPKGVKGYKASDYKVGDYIRYIRGDTVRYGVVSGVSKEGVQANVFWYQPTKPPQVREVVLMEGNIPGMLQLKWVKASRISQEEMNESGGRSRLKDWFKSVEKYEKEFAEARAAYAAKGVQYIKDLSLYESLRDPDKIPYTVEHPIQREKFRHIDAPSYWNPNSFMGRKIDNLVVQYKEAYGKAFKSRFNPLPYSKDWWERMPDEYTYPGLWDHLSQQEKIFWHFYLDKVQVEVVHGMLRNLLSYKEMVLLNDCLNEWTQSSAAPGSLEMMGALIELGVQGGPKEEKEIEYQDRGARSKHLKSALAKAIAFQQAFFQVNGIESVSMYRGMDSVSLNTAQVGDSIKVPNTRQLSSMSLDLSTANNFGSGGTIRVRVPVSNIIISAMVFPPLSRFDSFEKAEVIVGGLSSLVCKKMPTYDEDLLELLEFEDSGELLDKLKVASKSAHSELGEGVPSKTKAALKVKKWEEFLKLFYEEGKKKVKNPNPKTKDRFPEVQVLTAMRHKPFAKKIREEFHAWLDKENDQIKNTPSSKEAEVFKKGTPVASIQELDFNDIVMMKLPGGKYLSGLVRRFDFNTNDVFILQLDKEGAPKKWKVLNERDFNSINVRTIRPRATIPIAPKKLPPLDFPDYANPVYAYDPPKGWPTEDPGKYKLGDYIVFNDKGSTKNLRARVVEKSPHKLEVVIVYPADSKFLGQRRTLSEEAMREISPSRVMRKAEELFLKKLEKRTRRFAERLAEVAQKLRDYSYAKGLSSGAVVNPEVVLTRNSFENIPNAPKHWNPNSYLGRKMDEYIKEYEAKLTPVMRGLLEEVPVDAHSKKEFGDDALWDQMSEAERKLWVLTASSPPVFEKDEELRELRYKLTEDGLLKEVLGERAAQELESLMYGWQISPTSPRAAEMFGALDGLGVKGGPKSTGENFTSRIEGMGSLKLKDALAKIYAFQQIFFRANGITHLTLFRGMSHPLLGYADPDTKVEVPNAREITSTSINPKTAYAFYGSKIKVRVPVEQVFISPLVYYELCCYNSEERGEFLISDVEGITSTVLPPVLSRSSIKAGTLLKRGYDFNKSVLVIPESRKDENWMRELANRKGFVSRTKRRAVSIFDASQTTIPRVNRTASISIFDTPTQEQLLQKYHTFVAKDSRKISKEDIKKWKEFLKLFYEGGKKKVENPNLKTRDRWPKVSLYTALKVPKFAKKVQEEFHRWKAQSAQEGKDSQEKREESEGGSEIIGRLRSILDTDPAYHEKIEWTLPNGKRGVGYVVKRDEDILVLVSKDKKGELVFSFVDDEMLDKINANIVGGDAQGSRLLLDVLIEKPAYPTQLLEPLFTKEGEIETDLNKFAVWDYAVIGDNMYRVVDIENKRLVFRLARTRNPETGKIVENEDFPRVSNAFIAEAAKEGRLKRIPEKTARLYLRKSGDIYRRLLEPYKKQKARLEEKLSVMEGVLPKKTFSHISALSHWKPNSYMGRKIDTLVPEYRKKFGKTFKRIYEEQQAPEKVPDRYVSQKAWDQLPIPEKKLWMILHDKEDVEELFALFDAQLTPEESDWWEDAANQWQESSSAELSLGMAAALSTLGVKGRPKTGYEAGVIEDSRANLLTQRILAKAIAFQQAFFNTLGLDKITLYRGGMRDPELNKAGFGDFVSLENARQVSSTTIDPKTAWHFSDYLIKMRVPVSQVIMSPMVHSLLRYYTHDEQAEVVLGDLVSVKAQKMPNYTKYVENPGAYEDLLKMAKLFLIKSLPLKQL